MPLDYGWAPESQVDCCPTPAARQVKQQRGKRSYLAGLAAEDSVARHLELLGMKVVARRWRGQCGEIDIVARDGGTFVFVEVKQSRTHGRAMQALGAAQQRRLWAAAEEFLALSPRGSLSEVRLDLATVDASGRVAILQAALTGF